MAEAPTLILKLDPDLAIEVLMEIRAVARGLAKRRLTHLDRLAWIERLADDALKSATFEERNGDDPGR